MRELIRYFLYLGSTGFGGPLVLIQQMRNHYVDEKKQIEADDFDQAFALIKAMPGPVAFQMAVFLGKRFKGFYGGFLAGACLLLPAFLMMLLVGYFYENLSQNALVNPVLEGLLYAASAVILLSLKSLINANKKEVIFWILLAINLVLFWFALLPEPVLIILFGLIAVIESKFRNQKLMLSVAFFMVDWPKIFETFKTCLYAGAVVFGTGFALLPVLKTNLVDIQHLIDLKQFNDGVTFGQMTPGPITITASFLGYEISGLAGALIATIGVFFFPFFHMSTWFPHAIGWLTRQKWIKPFVMGATSAVVAGIAIMLVHMNEAAALNPIFWIIFFASLVCLYFRSKTPIILLFGVAGIANLLLTKIF